MPGDPTRPAADGPERPRPLLAPFGRRLLTVTANDPLGSYRVLRAADPDGPRPLAGQFAMLAAAERWGAGEDERPYLPRAFSYARFEHGEAYFLLEDVGPGTRRLCELREGEGLWLLGPLGQGFEAPAEGRRAVLVGGGVGIAPLAIWREALADRGERSAGPAWLSRQCPRRRTVLFGASGEPSQAGPVALASDDGSVGHHGFVTDLLSVELDRDPEATVYACGPPPMLEAVRALCAERGVRAQLALEAGMACGFGACYGCVVPTREGYLRACVNGPVIDASVLESVTEPGGGCLA